MERASPRGKDEFHLVPDLLFPSSSQTNTLASASVVARRQDIWTAATETVGSLGNYGATPAKLNALEKKIEDFQSVQAKAA